MRVLAMAGVTLLRLARDRLALFFIVLLPVVIILVIGITFADGGSDRLPVGVLDRGGGPLGAELRADLAASPALAPRGYDGLDALRKAVRRGVVAAGVVVPAGYDQALRAEGADAPVTFVVDQTRPAPAAVRSAVAAAVARQAAVVQAARFAAGSAGVSFDAALGRARTLGGRAAGLPAQRLQLHRAEQPGADQIWSSTRRLTRGNGYSGSSPRSRRRSQASTSALR